MNKKNIFITGATGKIGTALVNALDPARYRIFVLCRTLSAFPGKEVCLIPGDLRQPHSYAGVFQHPLDLVIHLAAVTHARDVTLYDRVNAEATQDLIRLCAAHQVKRFVLASTRAASTSGGAYGRSKLKAERYLKESPLSWVILRMAEVYGFAADRGMDGLFRRIKNMPFVPVIGDGCYRVAPVHQSDVVSVMVTLAEKESLKNVTYILAGPEDLTYHELLEKLFALHHVRKIKIHIPAAVALLLLKLYAVFHKDGGAFVTDQIPRLLSQKDYDLTAAQRDLNFHPRTIESFLSGKIRSDNAGGR
jgi:NADH dehydrogenase